MFYVYSPAGQIFSGPLENLRRVEKAYRSTSSRRLLEEDEDETYSRSPSQPYEISQKAISEYQSMLRNSSAKEAAYHAYQIMSQPVVTVKSDEPWTRAYELFEEVSYQLIPVLDAKEHVVAALSRRLLYQHMLSKDISQMDQRTSVIDLTGSVDRAVISAAPVTDVRRIASAMLENKLDAVPIVEESHRLIGIVSRTDILKCVTSNPPLSMWC